MGPVLATPDSVSADATVLLRLNGDVREEWTIDRMKYSVLELIEKITTYLTLRPGDVVMTGTADMGPLSDGDRVSIEIEGIGTFRHRLRLP